MSVEVSTWKGVSGASSLSLLLLALIVVVSTVSRAAPPSGLSAATLASRDGITNVSLSPTGRWITAHALSGEVSGLIVRRMGRTVDVPVFATEKSITSITWLGADDLLFASVGKGLTTWTLARFSMNGEEPRVENQTFLVEGGLVDGLPLEENTLLWEFEWDGQNSVHRISISDLLALKTRRDSRGRVVRPGERVAKIRGSAAAWVVDRAGRPRAALRERGETYTVLYRGPKERGFREVYRFEESDPESHLWPAALNEDETKLLVLGYGGKDTQGLYEFDPETGALGEEVFRLKERDITALRIDPYSHEVIAAIYGNSGEPNFHYFDTYREHFVAGLDSAFPAESTSILGSTFDRRQFVFEVADVKNPGDFYLRDLENTRSDHVGRAVTDVDRSRLSDTDSFVVDSTDGVQVEAFLTLPKTGSAASPLVVMPHGGPFGIQDKRVFDPLVQYLASWGFAVLQPNYRGSSGYGRAHLEAGKKEWARGIEEDIEAAVQNVISRTEVNGDRVCIVGGSYGGFSALASVIRYPGRYRCAISINGVSDIPLLYDSSDMADSKRVMKHYQEHVGDLETERELLVEASPAYHADEIGVPVFLIYGTEDRRVDRDHSHRMMLMLDLFGKEFDSLEIEGMRHGYRPLEARIVFRAIRRNLTKYLQDGKAFVADPPTENKGAFGLAPRLGVDL